MDRFPFTLSPDATITPLFESQVEKTPDSIALIHGNEELTYRKLNERANQLARYLRAQGVGPEVSVGICMDRSLEMVIAILGILKAGGAYLPLDPNYPAARLALMLEDASPKFLLTQTHLAETLQSFSVPFLALDSQWAAIAGRARENLTTGVTPDHLAYIIYTSGSTGQPKGVMIEHRSLVNFTEAAGTEYAIDSNDRVLQFASISFDASVEEIFPCLTHGATLVLRTDTMIGSAEGFLQSCREMGLTVLDLPTSYWHQLVGDLAAKKIEFPESLRLVIIGGEKAQSRSVMGWFQHAPRSIRLVNTYGPTEATVVATKYDISAGKHLDNVPIGRPLGNVEAYILHDHLQPVPIGVPGELYLGGDGLARGYLNQPELTAEKFISNPFAEGTGARLYRTGDLARYLPDGNIEFLGRVDNQVKIRGFRIELGEIESAMQQHPAVKQALALAREDMPGEKRLVLYFVAAQEKLPANKEWRQFLRNRLPDYMIPSAFVALDRLPISPNGKVDLQALPEPKFRRTGSSQAFTAPRTAAEKILVDIWSDVLKYDQIGVHDNFFDLGGDSILSIQITSRANQAGLSLTPNQIFRHQTIAGLAAVAAKDLSSRAEQGIVTGPVPLTPSQKWFLEQEAPEHRGGHQTYILEVRQPLDPALLEEAFRQLLIHHDALRLRIWREESVWHQSMAGLDLTTGFSYVRRTGLAKEERGVVLDSIVTELQAGLDLLQGSLLKAALVDFGSHAPVYLLLVLHQIAIDDDSWGILLEDLDLLCQQLIQKRPVQLQPKTTSYKSWAQRLAKYVRSDTFRQELPFWQGIDQFQASRLPADSLEAAENIVGSTTDRVSAVLSMEDTRSLLTEVPKAYRTMSTDVLLTALVDTFSRWTGKPAFQVDFEAHGREAAFDQIDLSRTIGCFSVVYPIVLDLSGLSHPAEKLKSVKEQLRKVPQGGIGWGLLDSLGEEELVQKRQASSQSEVMFHHRGSLDSLLSPTSIFKLVEEFPYPSQHPEKSRKYRITITTYIFQGQLHLIWAYNSHAYRRTTMERLARDFMDALKNLIRHCRSSEAVHYTPSDFPEANLSQQELDDLLTEIDRLGE